MPGSCSVPLHPLRKLLEHALAPVVDGNYMRRSRRPLQSLLSRAEAREGVLGVRYRDAVIRA